MDFGLPPERNTVHVIDLEPDVKPVYTRMYRLSPAERRAAADTVTDLLKRGLVEPSTSPWSSSIVMAAKADGSLRACVDYRRLNALTKRNRAPLWRQDDLFDMLHGAKYFSSLDLTQGYHQIRIAQSDVERTAFAAPGGLYQFKMLPFGLCNAPSAFSCYES